MSGSSYDRRKALRAKERLSKRAMSEGRYPWLESVLAHPEKPAEAEDAISAASALRSGGKPPKEVIPDTTKPIAPPEPRGEAEGVPKVGDMITALKEYLDNTPPEQVKMEWDELGDIGSNGPRASDLFPDLFPEKKRPLLWRIWRGLRKLVGWKR